MSENGVRWKKHMIFKLNEELFTCPLSQVKEVVGLMKMTPVPGAPPALRGLINLRGKVLPVFDLSEKMCGKKSEQENTKSCILITESIGSPLGLLVDDVVEVISIDDVQIEKGQNGANGQGTVFEGVLNVPGKPLILLLSLNKIFANEDVFNLTTSAA